MTQPPTTRRRLLAAGGAASLAALAGCSGILGDDDSDASGDLDAMPADTEFIVSVDVQQVLNDDLLAERLREMGEMDGTVGEVPTMDELLDQVEAELGLDPRGLSTALLFATSSGDESGGAIIEADWSESDLEAALENEQPVETTTYQDRTVHETPDAAVGVLSEGQYVVGLPDGVRRSIDAATGNAPSVDNAAATAYEDAPDGYVRFGFAPPADAGEPVAGGSGAAQDLQHGSGALSAGGGTRGAEIHLEFGSSETAGQTVTAIEAGLARAGSEISSGMSPELGQEFQGILESTDVSQDGSTVTVEMTDTDGWLPVVIPAVLTSFVLGLGSTQQQRPAPQAGFEFDYDDAAGTVTITHTAGDTIRADRLYVYGDAVNGSWPDLGGDASGTADGAPGVVAGDSLTVDADPGARVDLIWEGTNRTVTLATFEVPG